MGFSPVLFKQTHSLSVNVLFITQTWACLPILSRYIEQISELPRSLRFFPESESQLLDIDLSSTKLLRLGFGLVVIPNFNQIVFQLLFELSSCDIYSERDLYV